MNDDDIRAFIRKCEAASRRLKYYMLQPDGKIIVTRDTVEWARWYEGSRDQRVLKRTELELHTVSTVFLGLDHGWESGKPVLWETMVFEKDSDGGWGESLDCWRYDCKDSALVGHEELVRQWTAKEADGRSFSLPTNPTNGGAAAAPSAAKSSRKKS